LPQYIKTSYCLPFTKHQAIPVVAFPGLHALEYRTLPLAEARDSLIQCLPSQLATWVVVAVMQPLPPGWRSIQPDIRYYLPQRASIDEPTLISNIALHVCRLHTPCGSYPVGRPLDEPSRLATTHQSVTYGRRLAFRTRMAYRQHFTSEVGRLFDHTRMQPRV
jgi:hypothetical protein